MNNYSPQPGIAYVELLPEFGVIQTPGKSYDSTTQGTILSVHHKDQEKYGHLVGKIGYWRQFKDDLRIDGANSMYAFIELKDIFGIKE